MKKFLSLVLAAVMTLSVFSATAYATETGTSRCNITFDVTDETGSYPGSSIEVTMLDDANGVGMGYTLYAANSWTADTGPTLTVTAGTYTVTISGLEDGYKVVNTADYSEDLTFTAESDITLAWSIIYEDAQYVETEEAVEEIETVATVTVNVSDEEAAEVLETFVSAVSYIADDPNWEGFLNYYNKYENNALNYIKYFGGTEEDWAAIDPFDQFLIYETYIRFELKLDSGMYSKYFDTQDEFESTAIKDLLNRMDNVDGSEDVQEAYIILADWQYEQIVNNHAVYNFFEVATEEIAVEPETEEVVESEEVVEEEITEEIPAENTEDEDGMAGMWASVLSSIKSHTVEIGIGVVGLAVLGVVFIVRNRHRYDDYDFDDDEM